ncbi:UNVERIFIED_CONTAM: tape measure protein [Comamonas sp. A-3]
MAEKVGEIYYEVTLELDQMIKDQRRAQQSLDKTADSLQRLSPIATAVKAALSGLAVMKIIDMADEWGQYASRIKQATKSTEEYAYVQERMLASANSTFRSINETRESFIQLSPVLREMGLSLGQSVDVIDAFSGLLVTNAASAEKAKGAQDALAKSLQKGRIDADAWMSIYSTLDSVVDIIAASSGKSAAEIRKLGAEGKLSINTLVKALADGAPQIAKQVEAMPTSVKDALQNLNNGFGEYIGRANEAHGITATLAKGIGLIGKNFSVLADSGLVAAAAGLTAYGARAAWAAIQSMKLAQEAARTEAANAAASAREIAAAKMSAAADLERARAAVVKAEAQVAADRMVQVSNLERLRTAQAQLAAENALEVRRIQAQINDIGRQKAATRLAEIRMAEVAITKQVEAAEKSLAATTVATSKTVQTAYAQRSAAAQAYAVTTAAANQSAMATEKAAQATSLLGRAGGALLGALGGPMGMAVTIGLSTAAWLAYRSASDQAKQSMEGMGQPIDEIIKKFGELDRAQQEIQVTKAQQELVTATKGLDDALQKVANGTMVAGGQTNWTWVNYAGKEMLELNRQLKNGDISSQDYSKAMTELINRFATANNKTGTWRDEMLRLVAAATSSGTAMDRAANVAQKLGQMAHEAAGGVRAANLAMSGTTEAGQKAIEQMQRQIALYGKAGAAAGQLYDIEQARKGKGPYADVSAQELDELEKGWKAQAAREKRDAASRASAKAEKFDSAGYLLGLSADAAANEWSKIDAEEKEALSKHKRLLDERKLSQQKYEEGVLLIQQKYGLEREKLQDGLNQLIADKDAAAKEKAKQATEDLTRQSAEMGAALAESIRTPAEQLEAARKKFQSLLASKDIDDTTYGRLVKKAEKEYQNSLNQMDQFTVRFAQNVQDQLGDTLYNSITGNFKDIGTAWGQMLLKMGSQAVAANLARSLFGGAVEGGTGSGMFGSALSAIGSFFGLSGKRENGGDVGAGKMYEVNERGVPELLTVGNKQLLMMAGQSGSVTPLGGMDVATVPSPEGRGGSWTAPIVNVNILGAPSQPERVSQRSSSPGRIDVDVIFKEFEDRIGDGIANGSGTPYRAMKGRFGLSD